MIIKNLQIHFNRIFMLLYCLLMFSACNQLPNQTNVEDNQLTFNLPQKLASKVVVGNSSITATAEIVGRESSKAQLTITEGSVSGSIPEVPYGDHILKLVFSYIEIEPAMELVIVEKPITVTAQTTRISILERDFHYVDSDEDGYGNLIELEASTNPEDNNDYPQTATMFVSSIKGPGDLSQWDDSGDAAGIDAGDNICNQLASNAGLEGEYRAWLSTSFVDAYCHLLDLNGFRVNSCDVGEESLPSVPGPWIRPDKKPLAENLAGLIQNGIVYQTGMVDENASVIPDITQVWTGTETNGTGISWDLNNTTKCDDWNTSSDDSSAWVGSTNRTLGNWTAFSSSTCGSERRLFCFQINQDGPLPDVKSKGKGAFVTSMQGNGNFSSWVPRTGLHGLEAADAVCKDSAARARLDNFEKYKAWISTNEINAIDRLKSNGPWVRVDGTLLAKDKQQLLSESLLNTPLSVSEQGDYIWDAVWTGTLARNGSVVEFANCQDWTSDSTEDIGVFGLSITLDEFWTTVDYYPSSGCNRDNNHLYCFEDE